MKKWRKKKWKNEKKKKKREEKKEKTFNTQRLAYELQFNEMI